jgi:signal recognition particle subunit SRP19
LEEPAVVTKDEGQQVLWPRYFDKGLSKAQGRRVSKEQAVPSPRTEDIAKAVKELNLKFRVEPDAAHPSAPWKPTGRVVVQSDLEKTKLIKWVAKRLG